MTVVTDRNYQATISEIEKKYKMPMYQNEVFLSVFCQIEKKRIFIVWELWFFLFHFHSADHP